VGTFLEDVADTAEEIAAEQRQVARQARSMQRARDHGTPWADMLDRPGAGPGLLGRLKASGRQLAAATARLSQGLAEALAAEGHSDRAIARRLGVTHQRISAMLGRRLDRSQSQR
jgi:hypothetical protein